MKRVLVSFPALVVACLLEGAAVGGIAASLDLPLVVFVPSVLVVSVVTGWFWASMRRAW